jgi:hypothetical protein
MNLKEVFIPCLGDLGLCPWWLHENLTLSELFLKKKREGKPLCEFENPERFESSFGFWAAKSRVSISWRVKMNR